MKNMKVYKFIVITATVCFGASCSSDFLELAPKNEANVQNFYQTASDFNIAVIACYSKLQGQINYYTELSEYRSDNLYLNAPTAGTQDRYDVDHFVETPSNGILQSYWANFYNGVFRCNLVINKIDDIDFDEQLKEQYKGEALFIRALTYFNLYRTWGGVPVTLKVVSPSEALGIGRSTSEEMYHYIVDDLKKAVDYLPESYGASDIGRATSNAARALLGKVYLTFGKYEEARDILGDIIDKYTLEENPQDVFDVNNEMNGEIVFAIRFSRAIVDEGHGLWFTTSDLSVSPIAPELIGAYDNNDKRKELLEYVKSGNVYVVKKYYDELNATTQNAGNDYILLRYADVLLMYAEVLNEISYNGSDSSPALKYLNDVHTRAGLNPIKIAEVPNQESFRKAILDERRKEFPLEGHRWFDLIRMGAVEEEMHKVGLSPEKYRYVYPIPKTELERVNNNSLLWQNPEY